MSDATTPELPKTLTREPAENTETKAFLASLKSSSEATKALPSDATIKLKRSKQTHDAIADIIKDIPRGVHLTAPEVFRRVREMGLQVSLSTVYRTLNMLQADGNVSTVSGDHGKRYESRDSDHDHDHLICLKCGLTIEFTDDLIRGFGKTVAERKGYEHRSSRFDILGICATCKAKDEDHKISMSITALENSLSLLLDSVPKIQAAISALESRKPAKALEITQGTLAITREASAQLEASVGYFSQRAIPVE